MRPLFQLDPRLSLCASFVPAGAKLADIGTDHGYLPIWLAKTGRVIHAVAADLRPGPLERAKDNVRKYQVEDLAAPWLKETGARLVLQPMTRAEELRRFLAEHGFEILEERPVLSLGRPYSVLLTAYTGRQEAGGILFPYLGKLLQSPLTDKAERTAALAYLGKQLRHLQNLEKGARAGGEQEAQMEYCQAAEALRQLIREEFPNGSN